MFSRFSLVVLLGLCTAGSASASWADALFDELSRDFGSVPRGPTLTHPFRLVNKTNQRVHNSKSFTLVRRSWRLIRRVATKR